MKFWILEVIGFIWSLPSTFLGLLLLLGNLVTDNVESVHHVKGLRLWFRVKSLWFIRKRFNACALGALAFVRAERFVPEKPWSQWQQQLYDHEDEHRRQCWILGPLVIPLYILFTLVAWVLYKKYYRANYLEVMARWKAGTGLEP
jgi:hypothetical protein